LLFCGSKKQNNFDMAEKMNEMNEMQRTSLVSQLSRNYGTLQARCSLSKQAI
jgi:hypothetical protein